MVLITFCICVFISISLVNPTSLITASLVWSWCCFRWHSIFEEHHVTLKHAHSHFCFKKIKYLFNFLNAVWSQFIQPLAFSFLLIFFQDSSYGGSAFPSLRYNWYINLGINHGSPDCSFLSSQYRLTGRLSSVNDLNWDNTFVSVVCLLIVFN